MCKFLQIFSRKKTRAKRKDILKEEFIKIEGFVRENVGILTDK